MSAPDFFRSRLDQKIDVHHPSAVLASRLPWTAIEARLARSLARQERSAKRVISEGLLGVTEFEFGARYEPRRAPTRQSACWWG